MSLEESLLEEVLKEEKTPVTPCSDESGNNSGGTGSGDGDTGDSDNGEADGDDKEDEGGRPLPIIPPGGPATPPTNP